MKGLSCGAARPAARRAAPARCSARTRRRASCSGPTASCTGDVALRRRLHQRQSSSPARWPTRCGRRCPSLGHALDARAARSSVAPPVRRATPEKLTSSTFLPGIDALSFSGESSAFELAVIDDRDAIAQLVGFVHVVRRDEDREVALLLDLLQHLPDGDARDRIEAGRRLVEEEDARLVDQAARDLDAAPHAARQVLHLLVGPLRELDGLEQLGDELSCASRAARRTASRR